MKIRDVMTASVVTVDPATPFPDLVDLMVSKGISGLPVTDEDGRLVGIVTEADLVSKEAYGGRRRRVLDVLADFVVGGESRWAIKAKGQTAAQVMTTQLHTVSPTDDVRRAARTMVEAAVKRLPVVEDGRLVGIVARTDLLRVLHRDDADIEAEITKMLSEVRWAPDEHEVSVEVTDGVATFTGTVLHPMDRPLITAIGWHSPAVVDVVSLVTAREEDPKL